MGKNHPPKLKLAKNSTILVQINQYEASLVYWHKGRIQEHYILELRIHQVDKTVQYPDGVKYGLICKDLRNADQVLMDNHHPKGHHIHIKGEERAYSFRGNDALIEDFKALVWEHLEVKI